MRLMGRLHGGRGGNIDGTASVTKALMSLEDIFEQFVFCLFFLLEKAC